MVFLGNPGKEYLNSRHNAGFMTADAVERQLSVKINKAKFHALTAQCCIAEEKVLLMKPQTYMNLSGEAVEEAAKFYKVNADHIIVVSDETALNVGRIRVRSKGSAGGHNGLKNIIQHLGTDQFPRVRIGVGSPPHPDYDLKDWVLAGFSGKDAENMRIATENAAKAVILCISDGCESAMNKYNSKIQD